MSPDDLEKLIHARTSAMTIDPQRPVDPSIIGRLADAAQAAPNHRTTRPLRVGVVRGVARARFGGVVADAMQQAGDEARKVDKARTKYLRAPVVLVVAAARGASDLETEENRYAVAAGIQNMLLMIESFGLTALWGSPPKGTNDAITGFCGFDATDHVMAVIYLGWGTADREPRTRPEPVVRHIEQ
jgi:nitroreductase